MAERYIWSVSYRHRDLERCEVGGEVIMVEGGQDVKSKSGDGSYR